MFHKTSTKLAGLYLAIMMAISLFFSVNVYQLSVQEFDRGFRGQGSIIQRRPDFMVGPDLRDQIRQEQDSRLQEAKNRVLIRLVFINLFILVGGGFLSYYLARRTLGPIEEAHQALERFTADASHELRTPIAAMQSEIEVALMNPKLTLASAKDQLKSNLEELAKLTALSEGLLKLAQLENNDLQHQEVNLEIIVNKAISRVAQLAEKKHILIHSNSGSSIKIIGDEASLIEALVVVLDNAIKYSHEKTEIEIVSKAEHGQVAISVTDQGAGIKATELAHIFERFYRADTARSKHAGNGYGLGLAIAKSIVELHEGTITASSRPGTGSTFTMHLPLKGQNSFQIPV